MRLRDLQKSLECTQEQFESLYASNAKARSTSKTVSVDRQALTNLLIDHSKLIRELEKVA